MDSLSVLRDNLADLTSYGMVSLAVLIIGFAGLDLVTPGSLRSLVWRDNNRTASVLAVAQALGLTIALAAATTASLGLELWRGVLYTFIYGVVTVALMMFSFVLVDVLTPGQLGALLLQSERVTAATAVTEDVSGDDGEHLEPVAVVTAAGTDAHGRLHPAVWVNAVVFVALGVFVWAALGL